jgi:glycosyltransferase involved in cell wall biosynthesis
MDRTKIIRVLFFSRVPKIGGGETSLLAILKDLDRAEVEPVFAAVEPGPLSEAVGDLGITVRYCGPAPKGLLSISAKSLLEKAAYVLGAIPALMRLHRILITEHIDIAHANEALEAAFLWLPCKLAGVPLIWTVRNIFSMRPLYKFLYYRSAAVMAVSSAAAAPLVPFENRKSDRGKKLRLIYEGIDLPASFDAPFKSRPFTAAIIGRLSPDKGQELFMKAAALVSAKNQDLRFLVAGDTHLGDPDYSEYLKEMVQKFGLTERVGFTGFVPDIWEFLEKIDMVVMACPIEAFGRVTIEAMAVGRPVIGINAGGTAEIVLPGKTGLLIENDHQELARAMLELAGDPQAAVKMGQAGRRRAEEVFSIQNMINGIMEMYRDVMRE